MTESPEDRMDALLRDAAKDYNAPPPTPTAEIWARVSAARQAGSRAAGLATRPAEKIYRFPVAAPARRTVRLLIGIAALLVLGVAIGRFTAPATTAVPGTQTAAVPPSAAAPDTAGSGSGSVSAVPGSRDRGEVAAQLATAQHLGQAESFLIEFNTRQAAQDFAPQAQDLLSTTRLLLDSKRLTDARTRKLLEDLELVLVQIATLNTKDRREDLDLIADGLAQSHLRARLRSAIPTGPIIRM